MENVDNYFGALLGMLKTFNKLKNLGKLQELASYTN